MKKMVMLVLSILLLLGCSKDDDAEKMGNSSDGKINPPSWLLGKWYWNGVQMFEIGKIIYMGNETYKFDVVESVKNNPLGCTIKETINNSNEYNLEFGIKGITGEVTSFVNYHFKKISNDKIVYYHLGISEMELIKNQ